MDTQNNARGRSVFGKCFCYADIQRRKLTVEFVGEPSHAGAFYEALKEIVANESPVFRLRGVWGPDDETALSSCSLQFSIVSEGDNEPPEGR